MISSVAIVEYIYEPHSSSDYDVIRYKASLYYKIR